VSRGFATALLLVLIALTCIAVSRRLERERRLIATLHARRALDRERALPLAHLSADEQDTARDLMAAGVVQGDATSCYLEPARLGRFRRKRTRLALAGACGALALASFTAWLVLHRMG
jgi:hypothetical protein